MGIAVTALINDLQKNNNRVGGIEIRTTSYMMLVNCLNELANKTGSQYTNMLIRDLTNRAHESSGSSLIQITNVNILLACLTELAANSGTTATAALIADISANIGNSVGGGRLRISSIGLLTDALTELATSFASYTGQVATRTMVPDFINPVNVQVRARRGMWARSQIVNPIFRFPNFYVAGTAVGQTYQETAPGSAATITAALEYPLGTFTQILFTGVAAGTIPNGGILDCDAVPITIPAGAKFYVRTFVTNASGVVINLGITNGAGRGIPGYVTFGDALDTGASGIVDNTISGAAYTSTTTTNVYGPMLCLAPTTAPSILIFGDSISYGEQDILDGSGDCGSVARSIGAAYAYANFGIRGDSIFKFLTNSVIRRAVLPFFTHVIFEFGINDFIVQARTAAQLAADTQSALALMGAKITFVCTLLPSATTTDNYATLVNQTTAAWNPQRIIENDRRRTVPAGFAGCFDIAKALESSYNSGLITPGMGYFDSAKSTVHPQPQGYFAIQNAGLIPASAF